MTAALCTGGWFKTMCDRDASLVECPVVVVVPTFCAALRRLDNMAGSGSYYLPYSLDGVPVFS